MKQHAHGVWVPIIYFFLKIIDIRDLYSDNVDYVWHGTESYDPYNQLKFVWVMQ